MPVSASILPRTSPPKFQVPFPPGQFIGFTLFSGGPEIQKRFEQTLGEMQEDGRVKEKLSGTGAALPSAKAFLEGKGLVPESFLNDAEAPVDLKSKMQHKLDSTHGVS